MCGQQSSETKDTLRQRIIHVRDSLSDSKYLALSQAISNRLFALPEVRSARTVHVYWPMIAQHEVDIRSLIDRLLHANKQIVLPVVVNYQRPPVRGRRLQHVAYTADTRLRVNKWGILEPGGSKSIPVEALDVVIVPAIGADRHGTRIGHGFAFYDAFLSELTIPCVCPVFADCLVDSIPVEKHDRPVSVIVTEREVIRPGGSVTTSRPIA